MWGSEPHARMTEIAHDLVLTGRDLASTVCLICSKTEPGARNALYQLQLPSQGPSTALRAISRHVRSDKRRAIHASFESRHSTTRRNGAALAPRDARRDGARPRPARHHGAGPHKTVRVRPERHVPASQIKFRGTFTSAPGRVVASTPSTRRLRDLASTVDSPIH